MHDGSDIRLDTGKAGWPASAGAATARPACWPAWLAGQCRLFRPAGATCWSGWTWWRWICRATAIPSIATPPPATISSITCSTSTRRWTPWAGRTVTSSATPWAPRSRQRYAAGAPERVRSLVLLDALGPIDRRTRQHGGSPAAQPEKESAGRQRNATFRFTGRDGRGAAQGIRISLKRRPA